MLRRGLRMLRSMSLAADGSVGDAVAWAKAERAARGSCTDELALSPSIIPTRHFQRSLPRLPVPMLANSLTKYAAAVKPLVPPSQYDQTVKLLKEFEIKDGRHLQDELVSTDRANQHTSFISSDWFEKVLKERDPMPMHRSRTLLVRSPAVPASASAAGRVDMLSRATLWIRSSVLYYKAYLDNTLYPDVRFIPDDAKAYYQQDWFERTIALCPEYVSCPFMTLTSGNHAFPLDMSQHDNLFNSTRAPGVLQDEVRAVGFMPHIIVQHRGRQFAVTVADEDSNPLPEDQIYARLRAIVTSAPSSTRPSVDVGVFTTLPRTEWNGVRTTLLRNATTQKSLETLDSSMFLLNLDDDVHQGFFQKPRDTMREGVAKAGNRWWDKSFSVNVNAQGELSVTYEESWGDGGAVRRYVEDVYQHSMLRLRGGTAVVDSSKATEPLRELRWSLTPALEQQAAMAQRRLQQDADRLDVSVGVFDSLSWADSGAFGGGKASGEGGGGGSGGGGVAAQSPFAPSPTTGDGVVQLALQLAWWRLYGGPVAAAQPVTMNAFRRGRVDAVFPSMTESQVFLLAMTKGNAGEAERRELCQRARSAYDAAAKEVSAGAGIVAHFTALRNVAQRLHGRTPAIFTDPSYRLLMASQLLAVSDAAPSLVACTANPVPNGYGVTYSTVTGPDGRESSILLNVSAWKGAEGPRHAASDFVSATTEALADVRKLVS